MNYRSAFRKPVIFLHLLTGLVLGSCKVGDDDPAISLRSRDSRIKANWKLTQLDSRFEFRTFQSGSTPVTTIITSKSDGYSMHVQTTVNNTLVADSVFGINYLLKIKDDGKTIYETAFIQFGFSVKSPGEDAWYWLNTDQKKARLYLGSALQTLLSAGIRTIPGGLNLSLANLATDFMVDRLKSEELHLSYDKTTNQTVINGSLQQVVVSSKLQLTSK
jgi:hypothetical protein